MQEQDLIDKLIQGESEAYATLLTTYQDRVVNTCYRFVGHAQDAEDVAQEVFVEVLQSVGSFRGDAKLSTWIYRVAVTKSLDYVRKKTRKKRLGHLKQVLGFQGDEDDRPLEPADDNAPTDSLEQQERAHILNQAIAALPENQRIALTLNQYEGLAYAEVAGVMGTSVSAVESLLHRAKKNLRKRLTRYYDDIIDD